MSINPKFEVGDNVKLVTSGKIGTINKVIKGNSEYAYKIMIDGVSKTLNEKYLELYADTENEIVQIFESGLFGNADDLALFETWFRLKKPIEGNLYSYLGSRTLFNPYQFKPLLKFISPSSEERLFIADEVGVGKTIETGLLLMELLARGRIDRNQPVLIVCPNVLGPKWVKEMDSRFNLKFHLHDGKSLENMFKILRESKHMQNPWGIVSIQLIRTAKFMKYLEEFAASRLDPLWSLVVVDEAHHMRNNGTESNQVGHLMSALAQMMVMLSATPLNLRDEDLFNQMNILNPALFPDKQTFEALIAPVKSLNKIRRLISMRDMKYNGEISREIHQLSSEGVGMIIRSHSGVLELEARINGSRQLSSEEVAYYDRMLTSLSPLDSSFTRTLKRESMSHRVTRDVIKVPVQLSEREYAFYLKTIEAVQEAYLEMGGNPVALGFITNMPMRMLTSSIPAMKDYLHWAVESDQIVEDNPFDEEDEDEIIQHRLSPELRKIFKQLIEESAILAHEDTKMDKLEEVVDRMMLELDNKQIIIFSFFRRTLKYLKERLNKQGYRAEIISGEVPLTTTNGVTGRYEIMEKFKNKEIDILLSSEVGGEGLDFQFCQALINYDMPYNPMKIEQRIGRLDRFGQMADKVIIANMYLKDTVDEKIYHLLYDRIQLIEDSVGFMEPIIGQQLADLQKGIFENSLTEEQIEKRTLEIEIALAQSKIENERFENGRNELLGEDKISETIANMTMTDFVKPVDSMRLTKIFLENLDNCHFTEIEEDFCEITVSPSLSVDIEEYAKLPGCEHSLEELQPLLKKKNKVPVVFNGQKSLERPGAVFLPPSGHWMKFILGYMEQNERIFKVFQLKGGGSDFGLDFGEYFVPIFEVEFDGFRKELNLSAVPINLTTNDIPDLDFTSFMRLLGHKSYGEGKVIVNPDDLEDILDNTRNALELQMETKLENFRNQNRFIIESKVNSLRKGYEVRLERMEKRLDNHILSSNREGRSPSEEFIRLLNGQIEKDKKRTEDKISRLQDKDDLILSISLAGIALLEIGDE
ncbi:helicase-related protein [Proteiniclasticum sp.]|uniref:DEAD/DEAH box helicase n=1 Tax=Proteiniclasticum sp. TaxID=2053595 RepID=UPI00289C6A5C|nr:helicase-related protein [Proteiniclasticum sp.]